MEKFCNVYLIHEIMLNNQTSKKNLFLKVKRKKWTKMVLKKVGGGEGVDECVIQRTHKVSALCHVLNLKLNDRNNKNTTKVFKI